MEKKELLVALGGLEPPKEYLPHRNPSIPPQVYTHPRLLNDAELKATIANLHVTPPREVILEPLPHEFNSERFHLWLHP